MCAIAGILDFEGGPVEAGDLRRMCEVQSHRGPDDEGHHFGPGIGLGMRRLGIIDLPSGRQPIGNEDGTIWVVFNGEIYNFRDLRRDLLARGHRFSTAGDAEVIVHLYEERGADCVTELRGMFAFAVWDGRRQRLVLARDRLGVKPLYYVHDGSRLAFASELKALLALPGMEPRLDPASVAHLFAFLTTPPAGSILRGVRKLEPGRILIVPRGGKPRVVRYWDVAFEPDRRLREEDCVERLEALLQESVRLRLASDVPLGAFLSGGIDSSAVVATMARLSPSPVKTFTVGFADAAFDEAEPARRVARHLGTEHHELTVLPGTPELLEKIAWHLDEPFGDPSAIPTYLVSEMAARHVKVALSGDGGDELFAGYDRYVVEAGRRARRALPPPLRGALGVLARALPDGAPGRRLLRNLSLGGDDRYLDSVTLFGRDEQRRLLRPLLALYAAGDPWGDRRRMLGSGRHWLSELQSLDLKTYLPLDILHKVDRMSMAHGLEAREPLLDHRLVEFAATVPPELHWRNGRTKHLLKRVLAGLVPDDIVDRPKHGFAVPLRRWFDGPLRGYARDLLLSRRARERGVVDAAAAERLLRRYEAGKDIDLELWTAISFELWCRLFLDRRLKEATSGSREGETHAA